MSPTRSSPHWSLEPSDPARVEAARRASGLSRPAAQVLLRRGFEAPEAIRRHLGAKLTDLHDPALLPGMESATRRVMQAIEDRERILVHGDYDVDGVVGTALLMQLLRRLGAQASWHIPNRFSDGYSFGPHSIERAQAEEARLVISVDNGTSSHATIQALAERGIDTIVTDHHEAPQGPLPPAVAICNPKLPGSSYPFRELCGSAVAFKLAWSIAQAQSGGERVSEELRVFLIEAVALASIATVCDVVPLVDENRILARYGLRALANTAQPGLKALMRVAELPERRLEGDDVAFKLGPRLNAAGRLGSAQRALELLLSEDDKHAMQLARELDELNRERRRIEAELTQRALIEAEQFADAERWPVMVVAGQGWHQGVIGIVAARLVERFSRPALVIGLDGERGRGSARSVAGFDVLATMHAAAPHFERYGGHEQAAGCELYGTAVEKVRAAVCERAHELMAGRGLPQAPLAIDGELAFADMNPSLMRELDQLGPFGQGNEKPLFLSRDLRLAEPPRAVGADRSHLALRLRRGAHCLRAMAFGQAARVGELAMGLPLEVVYTPRWNTFRGETKLELELIDFRAGEIGSERGAAGAQSRAQASPLAGTQASSKVAQTGA